MSYQPLRAFAPLALMGAVPSILVVHPSLPVRSVKELVALTRAHPNQVLYATGGVGGAQSLAGAYFERLSGGKITPVQYRGTMPSVTALSSGEVSLGFSDMMVTLPLVQAGKLRLLAVTTAKRSAMIPDVPTVAEQGLPGFDVSAWFGLVVRTGTSDAIINKLSTEILRVLQLPDVKKTLKTLGSEPGTLKPAEFGQFLKAESDKWAAVIKSAGMQEK